MSGRQEQFLAVFHNTVGEDAPQSVLDQINAKLGLLPQVMTDVSFIKGQLTQIMQKTKGLVKNL